ncbi:arylsulfatase [Streptomyces sp. G44]|uniref:aspartate/glutamate racemase family protein n=1 Tax=Streptomyces sp. G44 TaxID=2807632 RepID=UPI001960853A|nr:aspartate/glutamate racemase family protein [Streptomyces sp. G44]MBM7166972.1 arylsulfatase [Streptomyces sp. G44]
MTLGLLHTSSAHVPVFDGLRDAHHPELALRHHVAASLLERAGRQGPEAVAPAVRDALVRAVGEGAEAVLCTCSTIGAVAEALGARVGVPVLRVDRPMAAAAVAAGSRVVVLATVESTLEPTVELVEEEARAAGREVAVRTVMVDGAWARFRAGDAQGYAEAVAAAISEVRDADAVVLAQASMAGASELVADGSAPVFASPRVGLAAAAAVAADRGGEAAAVAGVSGVVR